MKPAAFNAYVNWAMYAIMGRMAEADGILEQHQADIYAAARELSRTFPPDIRPLYRGVLLEPELIVDGLLQPDPRLTFASFSEDLAVACYFADPSTVVSGFVRGQRPTVEGYVIEHTPKHRGEMLFHHSWANRLVMPSGRMVSLLRLATAHPDFDEMQLYQLDWNVKTQHEVILKPFTEGVPVKPWEAYSCPPTRELDSRYTPPIFR